MTKEIIAVYQDCVLCGSKGKKKALELAKSGFIIRKVGFTTEEGKELIRQAVLEHKIGSMPFFTDGKGFTTSLDDFIEKSVKKTTKKTTKPKKIAEEDENVAV